MKPTEKLLPSSSISRISKGNTTTKDSEWKMTVAQKQGLEKVLQWIQWSIMIMMLVGGLLKF